MDDINHVDLEYARGRLAYYEAKPPYKTKDRGSFGWGAEIAFWRGVVERLRVGGPFLPEIK